MAEVGTRIEVSSVRKRFGSTVALDGMTFVVPPGLVTGFVGAASTTAACASS
jgi:ABC-2 type transport system ATP-binding protein